VTTSFPMVVGSVGLALALSVVATLLLLAFPARLPHAAPGARSLHVRPVPRVGGVAIWAGFLPAALLAPTQFGIAGWSWGVPWLALVAVSLRDDFRSVGVGVRLTVHFAAAAWMAAGLALALPASALPAGPLLAAAFALAALLIAWVLNLYNFMDGNDGLAALMAITGFSAYGLGALAGGAACTLFFALAAASVPFLIVNRPRARMFMGDVGAVPLGFLAAAFGLAGVVQGGWPAWFPVLVFLPFAADATVTLARRAWRREKVWEAHRGHYYQRLNQLGAGHLGTLAAYGAWMLGAAGSAVACLVRAPAWGWSLLLGWMAAATVFFLAIDYHWRKRNPTDR
jgi:UDP-GlcNAc:undecaprenyl-phosphate GlcNAc-1-phosphate transferase